MSGRLSQEIIAKADAVDLAAYARQHGYTLMPDGHDLRVVGYGGLLIDSRTHTQWCHHSQAIGGGPVQFLMHMEGLNWRDAVLKLAGEECILGMSTPPRPLPPPKKPFSLPVKAVDNNRVFSYLARVRGIDEDVIDLFISEGKLYQDTKGNCVFLSFSDGKPAHAFMRTTNSNSTFRRDEGEKIGWGIGRKHHTTLHVFESPIDVMSYMSLKRLHGEPYNGAAYLSLGGLSPKVLYRCLDKNPQLTNVIICTDNDKAGNAFFVNREPELERLGITAHRECPVHKDFNDDLLAEYGEIVEEYEGEP